MRPVEELIGQIDEALAASSFRCLGGSFVHRSYETTLDGYPLRATLSVFVDPGTRHRGSTLKATGFELVVEWHQGLSARFMAARFVPVLLRGGTTVVEALGGGAELRAHDVDWARAHLLNPQVRPALEYLAANTEGPEQRPGILTVRIRRAAAAEAPDFRRDLDALAVVGRASLVPPSPVPAPPRFADRRGVLMVLIAVGVVATFLLCGFGYYALVR